MNVTLQKLSVSALSHSPYFSAIRNFKVRDSHFSFQSKPFFVSTISKNFNVDKSSFRHYLAAVFQLNKDNHFLTCSDMDCSIQNSLFTYSSGEPSTLNVNTLTVTACSFNSYQAGIISITASTMTSFTFNKNCISQIDILSTVSQKTPINILGANSMSSHLDENALYTERNSDNGQYFFNLRNKLDCEYYNYTGAKSFTFINIGLANSDAAITVSFSQFYTCSFNKWMNIGTLMSATPVTLKSVLFQSVDFKSSYVIAYGDNTNLLTATFQNCGFFQITNTLSTNPLLQSLNTRVVTGAYLDAASQTPLGISNSEVARAGDTAYSSYISSFGFTLPQETYLTEYCHIYVTPTPTRSLSPSPSLPDPTKSISPSPSPEQTMAPQTPTPSPITLEPGYTIGVSVAVAIGSLAVGIIAWFALRPYCFIRKYPYLHYDF